MVESYFLHFKRKSFLHFVSLSVLEKSYHFQTLYNLKERDNSIIISKESERPGLKCKTFRKLAINYDLIEESFSFES